MSYGFVQIPEFHLSRAHPHHRAQRKALEDVNPHFDLKERWLESCGSICTVLAAIAYYPRIKAEHDRNYHLERFQNKLEMSKKGDNGHKRRSEGCTRKRVGHGGKNWDKEA
jgi:hypothetical protein